MRFLREFENTTTLEQQDQLIQRYKNIAGDQVPVFSVQPLTYVTATPKKSSGAPTPVPSAPVPSVPVPPTPTPKKSSGGVSVPSAPAPVPSAPRKSSSITPTPTPIVPVPLIPKKSSGVPSSPTPVVPKKSYDASTPVKSILKSQVSKKTSVIAPIPESPKATATPENVSKRVSFVFPEEDQLDALEVLFRENKINKEEYFNLYGKSLAGEDIKEDIQRFNKRNPLICFGQSPKTYLSGEQESGEQEPEQLGPILENIEKLIDEIRSK
jgi:hypothetical protein